MSVQKNKLFNFSHGVYNIDASTAASLNKSTALDELFTKLPERANSVEIVRKFHGQSLEVQREQLEKNPEYVIHGFIDVALKEEGNLEILLVLLPYLDSFLFCELKR